MKSWRSVQIWRTCQITPIQKSEKHGGKGSVERSTGTHFTKGASKTQKAWMHEISSPHQKSPWARELPTCKPWQPTCQKRLMIPVEPLDYNWRVPARPCQRDLEPTVWQHKPLRSPWVQSFSPRTKICNSRCIQHVLGSPQFKMQFAQSKLSPILEGVQDWRNLHLPVNNSGCVNVKIKCSLCSLHKSGRITDEDAMNHLKAHGCHKASALLGHLSVRHVTSVQFWQWAIFEWNRSKRKIWTTHLPHWRRDQTACWHTHDVWNCGPRGLFCSTDDCIWSALSESERCVSGHPPWTIECIQHVIGKPSSMALAADDAQPLHALNIMRLVTSAPKCTSHCCWHM